MVGAAMKISDFNHSQIANESVGDGENQSGWWDEDSGLNTEGEEGC